MELNNEILSVTNSETNEDASLASTEAVTYNSDTNRPSSSDSSQRQRTMSRSSPSTISLEERLRRVRAAEQLKQQQLYTAYLESQTQAELARKRQQEERKRKIEEMRQREETRRRSVVERRLALEQTNKLRIEKLRERSYNRMVTSVIIPRKATDRGDSTNRTASASPSLGPVPQTNGIMATSCILGFGSSAPRSILVGSARTNSSDDCNKLGQSNHSSVLGITKSRTARKGSRPADSVASPRSASVDSKIRSNDNLSVFDRLSTPNKHRVTNNNNESVGRIKSEKPLPNQKTVPVKPAVSRQKLLKEAHPPANILPSSNVPSAVDDQANVAALLTVDSSQIKETASNEETETVIADQTDQSGCQTDEKFPEHVPILGPLQAETHGAGEGAGLSGNEAAVYRAKLVEQRRLAKERKEEEQRRLEEENRHRRMQQEQARLAAEQAAREEIERATREAEEVQRRKVAEEMARMQEMEAERIAKLQKAEEERVLRKQKLNSIMSRFKQGGDSNKSLNEQNGSCSNSSSPTRECVEEISEVLVDPPPTPVIPVSSSPQPTNTASPQSPTAFVVERETLPVSSEQCAIEPAHFPNDNDSFSSDCATVDHTLATSAIDPTPDNSPSADHTSTDDHISGHSFIHNGNTVTSLPSSPVSTDNTKQLDELNQSNTTIDSNSKLCDFNVINSNSLPRSSSVSMAFYLGQSESNNDLRTSMTNSHGSMEISTPPNALYNRSHKDLSGNQFNGEELPVSTTSTSVTSSNFNSSEARGSSTDLRTNSNSSTSAPIFKSALLQTMLSGGRLSTHAKDAVAGLRRGSSNQLADLQGESGNRSNNASPKPWTQSDSSTNDLDVNSHPSSVKLFHENPVHPFYPTNVPHING